MFTALLLLSAAVACRPDDQRTDTMDPSEAMQVRENWPPEVVAQLDSGSAAFRADDHQAALAHYTRVTETAPDIAAGWFGVYMAQHALGNTEAAMAAYQRAQGIVPGATLIHPTEKDTVR
jgi:tetratricopeptide (TPR) repeat protein